MFCPTGVMYVWKEQLNSRKYWVSSHVSSQKCRHSTHVKSQNIEFRHMCNLESFEYRHMNIFMLRFAYTQHLMMLPFSWLNFCFPPSKRENFFTPPFFHLARLCAKFSAAFSPLMAHSIPVPGFWWGRFLSCPRRRLSRIRLVLFFFVLFPLQKRLLVGSAREKRGLWVGNLWNYPWFFSRALKEEALFSLSSRGKKKKRVLFSLLSRHKEPFFWRRGKKKIVFSLFCAFLAPIRIGLKKRKRSSKRGK